LPSRECKGSHAAKLRGLPSARKTYWAWGFEIRAYCSGQIGKTTSFYKPSLETIWVLAQLAKKLMGKVELHHQHRPSCGAPLFQFVHKDS
jgi:hypothetical protein